MMKLTELKKSLTVGFSALLINGSNGCDRTCTGCTGRITKSAAVPRPLPSKTPTDKGTYATGTPLQPDSKEGFWGHVNPFARKKWVKREMDPVKDRVNELDQLQAKNANDIRDVDTRATAGIKNANDAAALADRHAGDAATRADAANTTATSCDHPHKCSTRYGQQPGPVPDRRVHPGSLCCRDAPRSARRRKSDLDEMATRGLALRRATSSKCRVTAGPVLQIRRLWLTQWSAIS